MSILGRAVGGAVAPGPPRWDRPLVSFPARLKQARRARGLSQEGAARLVDTSLITISRWELGKVDSPDSAILGRLAEVYGTTVDWLLKGDVQVERERPGQPELEALIVERESAGRPIPAEVIARLRKDLHSWDGVVTRDQLVMLLPVAAERAAALDPAPPPVPEGRRRVPPARRR